MWVFFVCLIFCCCCFVFFILILKTFSFLMNGLPGKSKCGSRKNFEGAERRRKCQTKASWNKEGMVLPRSQRSTRQLGVLFILFAFPVQVHATTWMPVLMFKYKWAESFSIKFIVKNLVLKFIYNLKCMSSDENCCIRWYFPNKFHICSASSFLTDRTTEQLSKVHKNLFIMIQWDPLSHFFFKHRGLQCKYFLWWLQEPQVDP